MDDAEYQKEYDKAMKELEDGSAGKPTTEKPEEPTAKAPPEPEKPEQPKPEEPKEPPKEPETPKEPDPLEEIRQKLEKTEKALKDTQSWGTKNAQELARLRREADERQRAAERPAILDANPELEAAIKFVVPPPAEPEVDASYQWNMAVHTAHPGIFDKSIDPELEKAILARFDALPDARTDPLIAIREITAEKLAYAERQLGKRFAAESAKAAQKSAMSVPGAGGGVAKAPTNDDAEAVNRILNMSSADFEKERRKTLGY